MKVIIVSQNCYPYISPRANRATELAKEFARQGHEVVLYALLGKTDYSHFEKETKIKIKSLGSSRWGLFDNDNNRVNNSVIKVLKKFLGNCLDFPKIELMFLTKKALRKEKQMDLLITIAQPHTIHWGAAYFKKKNKNAIRYWVADCGDPYMLNPFIHYPRYFKYVEKNWCKKCDYITVPIESAKEAYYPEFRNKIRIVPQGFSFDNLPVAEYFVNEVPTFAYSGLFYVGKRDPRSFFEYLCSLSCNFRFIVFTNDNKFNTEAFNFEKYKQILGEKLEIHPFIPREELLTKLSRMDFLINIKNNSGVQQPSKLIDYALSGRPILEISSSFSEKEFFNEFLKGDYRHATVVENIEQYDIKNVVGSILALAK